MFTLLLKCVLKIRNLLTLNPNSMILYLFIWTSVLLPSTNFTNSVPLQKISNYYNNQRNQVILTKADESVADKLSKEVRVLCWVLTFADHHWTRAQHLKATWGKRCTLLLFISNKDDESLPAINLNVNFGRRFLWSKTREAFRYIYEHHRNNADWFLKVDDDTYVVMDNLRFLLSGNNPETPLLFGLCDYYFNGSVTEIYTDGGAGYVISRGALNTFINIALNSSSSNCNKHDYGNEDIEMSKCLVRSGVSLVNSLDLLNRKRFFRYRPITEILKDPTGKWREWPQRAIRYSGVSGFNCCSEYSISFHYVEAHKMYELDYLIYHLRPYGIRYNFYMPSPKKDIKFYS